jgi:hypothetical protein
MACREPQRGDDRIAKQLVQLCLPEVEVYLHDDGSEPMMYDLDLWWPDGHVEAMEVTIAIDVELLRLDLRLVRHGTVMPARESTRNWWLGLARGTTEVRAVRGRVDHLLSQIERAGVTRFLLVGVRPGRQAALPSEAGSGGPPCQHELRHFRLCIQ